MSDYRWNTSEFAIGYDAAAEAIHPHYRVIQSQIIDLLPAALSAGGLVVDLGGGSGRLMERVLDRWPQARGIVLDQSEPFLALAERRLARFGSRAACILVRLQDDWPALLPTRPNALVSMSAIHHLEPPEKQALYRRCHDALAPGGVLLNGDEVRAPDDQTYYAHVSAWANHMRRGMEDGSIGELFHPALHKWIDRNVTRFGQPKHSGDDCHETIETQLSYFRSAGISQADCPWQQDLWAVLRGTLAA